MHQEIVKSHLGLACFEDPSATRSGQARPAVTGGHVARSQRKRTSEHHTVTLAARAEYGPRKGR